MPIILIITLYYDEKQFKKELKEKYDKTEWKMVWFSNRFLYKQRKTKTINGDD